VPVKKEIFGAKGIEVLSRISYFYEPRGALLGGKKKFSSPRETERSSLDTMLRIGFANVKGT
jgi:hypothetical protein